MKNSTLQSLRPLFEAILEFVPMRDENPDEPLQLQICSLDYSSYVGKIGIGRIRRGRVKPMQEVVVLHGDKSIKAKINQVLMFEGLQRVQVQEAQAGDIVLVNGIDEIGIGVTITDPEHPEALPLLRVDEPTLTMNFQVNTSPLAGREGKYVTSRQLRERLQRELMSNIALRVQETADADIFEVSGRGELHLTILLENMRGKKAVKCDACAGLEDGPACVRSCPTGAALRIGPKQFIDLVEESKR